MVSLLPRLRLWLGLVATLVLVVSIRLLPQRIVTGDDGVSEQRARETTFRGEDGREHVYLGDLDSYLWLRHARSILRTGSPCDEVTQGTCRDTFTNAPVGGTSLYARSLHVVAIARLHQFVTRFKPRYPLEATSYLVPLIVGALGVLPAFFVARRLAGSVVAGPFAAVISALHPLVLARTFGSDDDIWNGVLPLYALWMLMAALDEARPSRRVLAAIAAAASMALQVWVWRGWLFSAAVVLAALAATGVAVLWHGARRGNRVDLQRVGAVAAIFYIGTGVLTTFVAPDAGFLTAPWQVVRALMPTAPAATASITWPSAFSRVGELTTLSLSGVVARAGGVGLVLCGVLGLLLTWRPRRDTAEWSAERGTFFAAVGLTLWFAGAIYLGTLGIRYLLLLAAPLGIACGVAAGRFYLGAMPLVEALARTPRLVARTLLTVVMLLALLHPLTLGLRAADTYAPAMNDAWWDALTDLRATSPGDAIVHTWWDYGHWVKYVAERRVSADGTSLATHVPFWLAKALAASTEEETVGILRMLACGSDATPQPEGSRGALGRLVGTGMSDADAYVLLSQLVTKTRAEADVVLSAAGVAADARESVLDATHCTAPAQYLVLTNRLTARRDAWLTLGHDTPRPSPAGAVKPATESGAESDASVPFLPTWFPCSPGPEGQMVCVIRVAFGRGGPFLQRFEYREGREADAELRYRDRESDAGVSRRTAPGVIVGRTGSEGTRVTRSALPGVGVLIDAPKRRILLGAPEFLESTYLRLMFLEGGESRRFRKADERRNSRETVVTWRVEP